MFKIIKSSFNKYPVLRGMATYSLLWPSSNFIQQCIDTSREEIDSAEILRYFTLGTFAVAPTVYAWVKIAGFLVKGTQLRHALAKVCSGLAISNYLYLTSYSFYSPCSLPSCCLLMGTWEWWRWF